MAASLVGGAALGAVFGELLKAVEVVTLRAVDFKPILQRLSSTLKRIRPKIEEINDLNRDLGLSEEQAETLSNCLTEGPSVVDKCEKVKWWKYWKKARYTKKLMNLESMLKQYFDIDIQLEQSIDGKKILVKLERLTTNGGFGNGNELVVGWCGAPQVPDFVVGFDVPLQELKNRIMKGGEQVVVLSAPGGCGKTTLAKMLCHDEEIKEYFKDIFFVTFSKAPNLKVIIQKLFQHKGVSVPEFQTDEEAINQLEHMLKKIGLHPINQLEHIRSHPILLVLDDVWSGSESLVEKFKFQIPEYKILVTSRSEFPRFSNYQLKLLKDEDAVVLFRYCAFPQNEISNIPNDLVDKIIEGCRKFPLALEVVGKSLCGHPKAIWKRTLMQWSEGQSVFCNNSMNEMLFCLQTSFDALDEVDHIKECFLDLAAFPEDQRIPVTALVDMWVELYGLDEDGENSIINLYELSNRNLIKLVLTRKDTNEITGYYDEHFVTQHDLLRELAIHQSGPNPIIKQGNRLIIDIRCNERPRWWTEHMQHPIGAHLVSISTDEMFKSNWYNIQLPMVEVLVLNIQSRKYTLPQFMEEMDQLKVLIITNYGFCSAEIRNFPLLGHLSSLKRIRLEHVSISSISEPFLRLKNLQKISLVMCEIDEAFRTCTAQVPDMLPNLKEIAIDYCHDLVEFPVWLCNISCLQKLNITNCNELIALPEEFGKLENLEVLRLHACTKLKQLPESIGSLRKLGFLDLSVCISISKLPNKMGELCGLRKLHMRGCNGLSELPSSVQDLKQLKNLICDEETAYLWNHYKVQLTSLEVQVIKEEVNLDWLHDDIFS